MTKKQLLKELRKKKGVDKEAEHFEADELLLDFIADKDIRGAYNKIDKWYA